MKKETVVILLNIFIVLLIMLLQYKYLEYDNKIRDMIINIDNINEKIEKIGSDKVPLEQETQKNNQDLETIRLQLEKIENDLDIAREKLNAL